MQNPKIHSYTDIIAWEKSRDLAQEIYTLTKGIRDYAFVDQMRRACISVMNNIAEGYGRFNPREFKQFLSISKGSLLEVQSMVYLGEKLGYFQKEHVEKLISLTIQVDSLITGFIKKLTLKINSKYT